jgi:uncharacterized protein YceK
MQKIVLVMLVLPGVLSGCVAVSKLRAFAPGQPAAAPRKAADKAPPKRGKVWLGRRHTDPVRYAQAPRLRGWTKALPPPPPSADFSGPAVSALKNIYLNDTEGDCVVAAGWHCLGVATGNAGQLVIGTDQQINADFAAISGDSPTDPNNPGCDPLTANQHWVNHGFANTGIKLSHYVTVDPTSITEVQQAIVASGGALVIAMDLPDAWINPPPDAPGFTWDKAGPPNPANGHEIMAYGYDASGVYIDTWGLMPGSKLTYQALAYYAAPAQGGECYALFVDLPGPGPNPNPNPNPPPVPADLLVWQYRYIALTIFGNNLQAFSTQTPYTPLIHSLGASCQALAYWISEHVPGVQPATHK